MEIMSIVEKIDLREVLVGHYKTFGNERGDEKWIDYLLFWGLPVLLSFAYFVGMRWFDVKCLPESYWNMSTLVSSIFIPMILTLLTCLYSSREKYTGNAKIVLRQLCENSSYCVLLSMSVMIVALIVGIFDANRNPYANMVFVCISTHFLLTIMMVMKRFYDLIAVTPF